MVDTEAFSLTNAKATTVSSKVQNYDISELTECDVMIVYLFVIGSFECADSVSSALSLCWASKWLSVWRDQRECVPVRECCHHHYHRATTFRYYTTFVCHNETRYAGKNVQLFMWCAIDVPFAEPSSVKLAFLQ